MTPTITYTPIGVQLAIPNEWHRLMLDAIEYQLGEYGQYAEVENDKGCHYNDSDIARSRADAEQLRRFYVWLLD
jgi:hypothetical protein